MHVVPELKPRRIGQRLRPMRIRSLVHDSHRRLGPASPPPCIGRGTRPVWPSLYTARVSPVVAPACKSRVSPRIHGSLYKSRPPATRLGATVGRRTALRLRRLAHVLPPRTLREDRVRVHTSSAACSNLPTCLGRTPPAPVRRLLCISSAWSASTSHWVGSSRPSDSF